MTCKIRLLFLMMLISNIVPTFFVDLQAVVDLTLEGSGYVADIVDISWYFFIRTIAQNPSQNLTVTATSRTG